MSDGTGTAEEKVRSQYDVLPGEIVPVTFFGNPADTTGARANNEMTRTIPIIFDRAAIFIPPQICESQG